MQDWSKRRLWLSARLDNIYIPKGTSGLKATIQVIQSWQNQSNKIPATSLVATSRPRLGRAPNLIVCLECKIALANLPTFCLGSLFSTSSGGIPLASIYTLRFRAHCHPPQELPRLPQATVSGCLTLQKSSHQSQVSKVSTSPSRNVHLQAGCLRTSPCRPGTFSRNLRKASRESMTWCTHVSSASSSKTVIRIQS